MSNYYVYQRLEDLVYELNPAIVNPPLTDAKVAMLIDEIKTEKKHVQSSLQDLFYRDTQNESTMELLRKSHHSLVLLINKAYEMRNHELAYRMNVIRPLDQILHGLDQLLHWFYQNFNGYLTSLQPYPITKLRNIRNLIIEKKEDVRDLLRKAGNEDSAIDVVCSALDEFVRRIDQGEAITKHEADYHKDLLKDIERTNGHSQIVSNCPSLHELLVYWNLNSKECFSYFTANLEQMMSSYPDIQHKLDYLHLRYKYVCQTPELPGYKYDTRYPNIKEYFSEYLVREIEHLTKKIERTSSSLLPEGKKDPQQAKVVCNLSVDQLSLILRALYELKVITVKSLSELFKILVRYLATPNAENISWENMRRKSYAGENRDKQVSMDTVLKLAKKIQEY